MERTGFFKAKLYFTVAVTVAIWALLLWDHFHGGVPSHHLLADENMPAVSNWWGAVLLPILTWYLLYRIQKKTFSADAAVIAPEVLRGRLYGFAGALLFGVVLSLFFTFGYTDLCSYMLLGAMAAALFLPVYRAECMLGFVLGMTFTFGSVLPVLIGAILSLICFILYAYIRLAILYVSAKVMLLASLRK